MKKTFFLLPILLLCSIIKAQNVVIPCNGNFSFTRQITGSSPNSSYISQVLFIPNDINITNPSTITPNTFVNASVQYGGFIWTQDWNNSATSFTLLKVDANGATTPFAVMGMPAVTTFNNAGVDRAGMMYILTNSNPTQIHTINLATGTPTFVSTRNVTFPNLVAGESVIWGDISIDPTTNRVYCWYHPTLTVTPLKGLYEITGLSTATPALTKIGVAQQYTLGSLFFNERGQLFGYGGALGTTQDRIFAIDKIGGVASQYGLPDIGVSQSDGCECVFRLTLDREVSTPIINIPKCGVDTFSYKFSPLNFSSAAIAGIAFSDTLDSRLSYAFNAAAIQTLLQATYGASVVVTLSSFSGGVNNVVNITGMNLPLGSTSFSLKVKVDASNFSGSAIVTEQAYLKNINSVLGGPNEQSNDPSTFNPKDATGIAINLTGTLCLPPTANNFINVPMAQGNANKAIPTLTGADPDGIVVSYTISTIPNPTQGVLRISCPTTPVGLTCVGGFADVLAGTVVTPAEAARLFFDPAPNFVGNANFTFTATDNTGNVSNTANYVLPVTAQPPVSNNIMENSMINTNGPTAIVPLNSADADGTISSYQITTLPTIAQGVLSVPCGGTNPTLTGSTCVGGFQDLNAAVLSNYPAGIPLTAIQKAGMRFDPTAGFVGNATFNYNATDNSGNLSNSANYTIPVSATVTTLRPPLTDNISAQQISNSLGNTSIPPLKGSDLDGGVVSYTITTIPPATNGVLRLSCPTTPAGLTCVGSFAAILLGTVLTPAESARLFFDPAPGFTGNATFNYTALDNSGLTSNTSSYTIPVVNTPPTATNINTTAPFNGVAAIIVPLGGSDLDGTVDSFKIATLPPVSQGVLSVPCGTAANPTLLGAMCTGGVQDLTAAVLANYPTGIPLTTSQGAAIRFDPATGYSGTATFNYFTKDNNGNLSTNATYNITIQNQPPISNDITAPVLPNANASTAIPSLSSSDPDGSIVSYTIQTLPPATSGSLFYNNGTALVPVIAGQILTIAQISTLQFDPALNFTGVVNFTYFATDNAGNVSNLANYNLPISGVGNLPPIAQNIVAPSMPNTNGNTVIPNLAGSDPDGTVSSFTILSIPDVNEGILFYNNGTGLVPVTTGIVLTPAQITTLQFDPSASNSSPVVFTYSNTDNSGIASNIATYTIPVSSTPPIAQPIVAPTMAQTNGATAIPILIGSDADGSVVNYTIETLPPASQGILSLNGTAITVGQMLTLAQLAQLQFDPAGSYSGNVVFNYHVTDNAGLLSNSTTYTIPVSGLPPVSKDILAPKMLNTLGATSIPPLSSSDVDGSISSYVINSTPPASQGVLLLNGVPVVAGQSLTVAEIALLEFDPASGFTGDVIFNYTAFDNNGNTSNIATYVIPVGTVSALPIKLVNFIANRNNNDIRVNWNTENEINVAKYELYISIDANNYKLAASAIANNFASNNYAALLLNYTNNIYYLKLKIIELDGSFAFSNIIVLKNKSNELVTVFPNPLKTNATIALGNITKGNYQVSIVDVLGKLVWQKNMINAQANQIILFERTANFTSGIYFLKVANSTNEIISVSKMILE